MNLGKLVITQNAKKTLNELDVLKALSRYIDYDWGEVNKEDKQANDNALKRGERVLGVYSDRNGNKFWIITEADRSVTTILLPEDY